MAIPLPGTPVRGSKTGKPIMALLDLMGRTWALGIIWQLRNEVMSFSYLQERCESISPTLLTNRLKELIEANLVQKTIDGYQLTSLGNELFIVIEPLGEFSQQWKLSFINNEETCDE